MFKTVGEGLERYKSELRRYKLWLGAMREHYTDSGGNVLKWLAWSTNDYSKAAHWTSRLRGMARALGLTENEKEAIEKEVESSLPELEPQEA